MLDNLIFSLNATIPIFLMMVIGYCLKRIKWIDEKGAGTINKLVFRIFLPAMLFKDVAEQDFSQVWDNRFVLFCSVSTFLSIMIALFLSRFFCKDKSGIGEYVQASYRSATATLGIAFMTNIYSSVSMMALTIIGAVPIYNIAAVLLLSLTAPSEKEDKDKTTLALIKDAAFSLVTNPIILSIAGGLIWSLLKLPLVPVLHKPVTYLASVASTLALIGLGASFEFSDLRDSLREVISVNINKLLLFSLLFLPLAIFLGFRDEKIVAALIMLGSATTSSSFIMAKNMGHKGVISGSAVMTTTLFSAFTLTFWLFILKTMGYI
jgi:predicted permease